MVIVVIFSLGFTLLSTRLIYLQVIRHDHYQEIAIRRQYDRYPVAARRGNIYDSHGRVIAQSVQVVDVHIDGKLADQDPASVARLAEALEMPLAELKGKINPAKRFLLIREEVSQDVLDRLKDLKLKPVVLSERTRRFYPNGSEASHLVGFVNRADVRTEVDDKTLLTEVGAGGVEQIMEGVLRGIPGERRVVRDKSRAEIAAYRMADIKPRNGLNVILTIDTSIQHAVEQEADRLMEDFSPHGVHIVVVRPSTGEILAMTSRPTFDPNERKSMTPVNLRNGAIMDVYEPGSTFKLVTLSAILNEGIAELDTPVFAENGQFFYAGKWLKDTHPHGMITVAEALKVSSNVAFAKLALLMGSEKLYRYVRLMGFGSAAQVGSLALGGEQSGILRPTQKWSQLSLTRVPIGYEIGVTNLQMAMAVSAMANEGKLMEPRLIKGVVDDQGRVVKQYLPRMVRQVVDREAAAKVCQAMRGVVSDEGGTGGQAAVPGFTAGGKTGTSRKAINGSYEAGAYMSSFIGFLPADKPEFLVSIVVDQPQGKSFYGGTVAGPAFSNIATKVAQQLNLVPDSAAPKKAFVQAQRGGA